MPAATIIARLAVPGLPPTLTRADALARATRAFTAAGLETPALDARLLLQGVSGLDAARLLLDAGQPLGGAAAAYADAVTRRLAHEPVSRILGHRGFHGLDLKVTPATLDPRPETETLVDLVLDILDGQRRVTAPLRLLDYGTGTGCVLLALLTRLPRATGIGSDVSAAALEVARDNAASLGLAHRTHWIAADGPQALIAASPFDVVVSNPPYIPTSALAGLAPEVRDFDPHLALDGGPDGLEHYRRLIEIGLRLAPGGWIAVEVGAGQAADVAGMALAAGGDRCASNLRRRADLAGHTRCVAWQPQ